MRQRVNFVSKIMWGQRRERRWDSGGLMASKSFHGSCDPNVRQLLLWLLPGTATATPTKPEQRHHDVDYRHQNMVGTSYRPPKDRLSKLIVPTPPQILA